MVKELPKVCIEGKEYYMDERLQEYRRCDNPHDRISFDRFDLIKESENCGVPPLKDIGGRCF